MCRNMKLEKKNLIPEIYKVWKREFSIVFNDAGVLTFFLLLPLLYPLVYTLIYNPETVRNIPVAVVDNSRTASSRQLVREIDATEEINIIGYAVTLDEARHWHAKKACYGIVVIPENYDRAINRQEQAIVVFYSDMSLLIRYRAFLSALTDVALAKGVDIRHSDFSGEDVSVPKNTAVMLGDTTQGFASFVIPAILVLIIQQSLILGIAMLGGGASERRRRNGGVDPLQIETGALPIVIGKALCYVVIYIPIVIYVLILVPAMFNLPRIGSSIDILLFSVPLLFSSIFLGMTLQWLVKERESSMLLFVATSVIFLFLSGIAWPHYAMSPLWKILGAAIPSTWGINGFVLMSSDSSSLYQISTHYLMLCGLTAFYFSIAVFMYRGKNGDRE